ncbi:hypothetical protein B0H11DRAFT_2255711 [Mycena galericulata]|nr:hypothetical protein B0H11DRAFT_2255711 [Mycena galericulata]
MEHHNRQVQRRSPEPIPPLRCVPFLLFKASSPHPLFPSCSLLLSSLLCTPSCPSSLFLVFLPPSPVFPPPRNPIPPPRYVFSASSPLLPALPHSLSSSPRPLVSFLRLLLSIPPPFFLLFTPPPPSPSPTPFSHSSAFRSLHPLLSSLRPFSSSPLHPSPRLFRPRRHSPTPLRSSSLRFLSASSVLVPFRFRPSPLILNTLSSTPPSLTRTLTLPVFLGILLTIFLLHALVPRLPQGLRAPPQGARLRADRRAPPSLLFVLLPRPYLLLACTNPPPPRPPSPDARHSSCRLHRAQLPVAHAEPHLAPRRRHPVEILFNGACHAGATWPTGTAPPTYVPIASTDAVSPASASAERSNSAAACAPSSTHLLYYHPAHRALFCIRDLDSNCCTNENSYIILNNSCLTTL